MFFFWTRVELVNYWLNPRKSFDILALYKSDYDMIWYENVKSTVDSDNADSFIVALHKISEVLLR